MPLMLSLLTAPFIWALYLIIKTVLIITGCIWIPIAALLKAYKTSKSIRDGRTILVWSWPFMWLWSNDEDGILEGHQYYTAPNDTLQIIYWAAIRNPVNNLRYTFMCPEVKKGQVQWIGRPFKDAALYDEKVAGLYPDQVYYAWQGLASCVYVVRNFGPFGRRRLWVGFKVYPINREIGPTAYQRGGVGFTLQWRRLP